MAYPAGVITRPVTFGPAFELEDGDTAGMQVTFKATRPGVLWMETGQPAVSTQIVKNADDGVEQTVNLPVTDQTGWGDGDGNLIVPGADGHVFLYIVTVIFTQNGRTIPGAQPRSKVVPIPQGDLSPLDLDKLIPLTSPGGTVVSVPDIWSEQIAAAEAAAVAAANSMIDSDDFMAAKADDPDSAFSGSLAAKIETAAGDLVEPAGPVDGRVSALAPAKARVPVAPSVGTKPYDTVRNAYNLKPGHLRRWRAALANAAIGAGEARVACFGTSIAVAQGVATAATESYPNQLRSMIAARAGVAVAGTGPVLCHLGDTPNDSRWSYSGTWSKFNPGPTNRTVLYSCTSNGGTATFTSDLAGTIAEFWFSQSSGAFSFTVDGAAPSSGVTVTGGTYSAGTVTPTTSTTIGKVSVTGLSDATHVIVVTRITTPLYLAAACVRKANGLSVGAIGAGGARLSDTSLSQPYDLRTFMNTTWAPHLVIANFMTNEAYTQVSAATFKTQLDAMCVSIANAGSDLVLVGEIPAGGTDQGGAAMNLTAYRQALYEVADLYDLPILDQFDRWGSYTSANGLGFMSDAFHPNKKGYRDYAAGVLPIIA